MSHHDFRDSRPYLYFAAPLFNDAERTFNEDITAMLEAHFRVYLPQRDGGLMSKMVKQGISPDNAGSAVFRRDIEAILEAKILLAVLDGRTVDEGVAFELGVAFANGRTCVGLQTDSRRMAQWGNNPMIDQSISLLFSSVNELLHWASKQGTKALKTDSLWVSKESQVEI
jgi:nucleoside 2-deoxyribosyltransferase